MEDEVETVIHTDKINKNSNKHDQNFQEVCYVLERFKKKKKLRVHENKRAEILIKTGE